MEKTRILVIGRDKDSAYALRNVFELGTYEQEVALGLDTAKTILTTRHLDIIVLDPGVCLDEEFDLVDFQLDHGLEIPMIIVGGESTGVRRRIRSKRGVKVHSVPADGFKLLEYVKQMKEPEETT